METIGILLFLLAVAAVVYKMMNKKETFEQAATEVAKEAVDTAQPVIAKAIEEVKPVVKKAVARVVDKAVAEVEQRVEDAANDVAAKIKKTRKKKGE